MRIMLETRVQAEGQQLRQTSVEDLFLRGSNVVFGAAQSYQARTCIVNRIACASVAIARLSHGTRIDEVVHIVLQPDLFFARLGIRIDQAFDSVAMAQKSALQMRVSEKRDRTVQVRSHLRHFLLGRHIFVFIERRAVENLKAVDPFGTLDQTSQIIGVLRLNDGLSPKSRQACDRVEPVQVLQPGASFIVISADNAVDVFANPPDHRVGIGAVAHQVATADDAVVLRAGTRQHSAQRFPIGVNVAED